LPNWSAPGLTLTFGSHSGVEAVHYFCEMFIDMGFSGITAGVCTKFAVFTDDFFPAGMLYLALV
jgi:hypothetical protein